MNFFLDHDLYLWAGHILMHAVDVSSAQTGPNNNKTAMCFSLKGKQPFILLLSHQENH
jgi:hypothetical protein